MEELLKAVTELQKARGLSDRQLSLSLGIDPSTWCHIKSGTRPGGKVISAIARVYPELNTIVLNYMAAKAQ